MSVRNLVSGGTSRTARLLCGGLALVVAAAAPAGAYVIVTNDNRVYDVQTKPQVRGDMVLFQLDGQPVSLRMYDVNVTKMNELNHMFDSGASASLVNAQVRAMRPGIPTDDRVIVSSRLEVMLDEEYGEDAGIAQRERLSETPKGREGRGGRSAAAEERPFEKEARDAMSEAEQRTRRGETASGSSGRSSSSASSGRASARDAAKVADLDAEIAAEQEYLRKLTSGELTVSDLEGEIDRSMDKIKRLQRRRDDAAGAAEEGSGRRAPAGSREERWQQELDDAQAELTRLQGQQGGGAREREAVDERIGELQWKIDRLKRKLGQ